MALKSQINPHFLFNTLNNIYSFSITKKPNTSDLILKLSELTSYVLYDSDKDTVLISDEIEFISNFIELERIRVDEKVKIDFDVNLSNPNIQIAPLLFIPLVENIFNHGLHKQSESDFAKISITDKNNKLVFTTINTYYPDIKEHKKSKTGIGIKNLRKRLQLIYPDHQLTIDDQKELFKVEMIINIEQ